MAAVKQISLAVVAAALLIASFGFLAESGLTRVAPDKPFNATYTAIGIPMMALGVWVARKAGYKPLRLFKY